MNGGNYDYEDEVSGVKGFFARQKPIADSNLNRLVKSKGDISIGKINVQSLADYCLRKQNQY